MEQHNENGIGPKQESVEDQRYKEFQAALDEQERILKEIGDLFSRTPDRAEAEKIVLEQYAPRLDHALTRSRETLDSWLVSIDIRPEEVS